MKRVLALLLSVLLSAAALAAPSLASGDAAPPLALPDGRGQHVDLAKLRGKVVYVDFWASWCTPCRRSFPWMNELSRRYGDQGLTIVAVNVDRKREDADKFLNATPGEFTVVYDPAGATPAAWQVKAMPTSYLVDASGRIVLVESGFRDDRKREVEERIRSALGAR